ncbi:MAG: Crp/Fnr family transcriptional regulator [Olsenella sp.]|jgi:CRP-like cAMP-binding protein
MGEGVFGRESQGGGRAASVGVAAARGVAPMEAGALGRHGACPLRSGPDGSCLDGIRLFAKLPREAKFELMRGASHRSYAHGDVVVSEGDPISSILVIRRGRIKTFRTDVDGEEIVLDVLHEGQAIWHGMFMDESVYHYSVGCLEDTEVCSIGRVSFERMLSSNPQASFAIIRMLSTELVEAEEKAMLLGVRDPRRRVAGYLLFRERRCLHGEISLKLEDIAGSVCLRPETVSRNVSRLVREGVVKRLGRGKLAVVDHERLRRIAESESGE